jgi:microcin C transport system substrate-binding protein
VAKEAHWNNFMYFASSLTILPAHTYQGKNFLEDLNWELPNGSGPYKLGTYDKGNNIIFERRDDFWAKEARANQGVHNFDRIKVVVVRDENLTFEKFKKGELDFYNVLISREWVQETDFDKVQKGWIQKRKIYTLNPNGVSGVAVNMRRAPLDDVRVRKALAHLYNRELYMEKLFFNEYEYIDSYYPGSMYANPQNEHIEYSPEKAAQLLAEAGWTERDKQGLLVKDGKSFSLTLLYGQKTLERHLTIFQEDLKRAGIELNLKLLDWTAMFQLVDERNFDLVSVAWTGLLFPNPENAYDSSLADQENTNNIVGIKNDRIDEILEEYPTMFELDDRIAAVKEIDGLLYQEHPYLLGWYGPFERILYWNKFGMPDYHLNKFADHRNMISLWWYDEAKDKALQEAMKSGTPLEIGETVVDYWGLLK